MASDKPFNYYSGFCLLLSHFILSQTCSKLQNESTEESKLKGIMITWKKRIADLVKEAKSVAGFLLPSNFESYQMT